MHGEHDRECRTTCFQFGLSPYARGTPMFGSLCQYMRRFIPVCTGNTYCRSFGLFYHAVYPRMHGEHSIMSPVHKSRSGLSPYARGTQSRFIAAAIALRFIPVCTGNTPPGELILTTTSVYPRMHGEHDIAVVVNLRHRGLSPYARGTQRLLNRVRGSERFIPVCTGNTIQYGLQHWFTAVYPRMHGEHSGSFIRLINISGLSPYARGTHFG